MMWVRAVLQRCWRISDGHVAHNHGSQKRRLEATIREGFVYPDAAPYDDAVLLWASGIDFKSPPPPTVDFAFRADTGSEMSLFALRDPIDHVAAIVESFADLRGPT